MVKMDAISIDKGEKMRIKQELTNLKIGKQDPQLFEIPPGYQPSGMPGMPGAGMPSADSDPAIDNDEQASSAAGAAAEAQPKKPNKPGFSLDKLKNILRP